MPHRYRLPALLVALTLGCSLGLAPSDPVVPEPSVALPPAPTAPTIRPPGPQARTEDEQNTIDIFRAMAPATVNVTQTQMVVDYWNRRTMEVPAGTGTGFGWDRLGHIVTNYHVVDGGRSYTVTLYDQSEWPARLVGGDPHHDVAVLKIEAPADRLAAVQLPPVGEQVEVGQKTIAIGNAFGLDHTLTTGVVSALNREIEGYGNVSIRGMIQTDASINPGNSGGPLLDSSGQLIGMNTMIYSKSGGSAGIGFAVPVATVRRVVEQLIQTGRVERVGFGVQVLDPATAARIGVTGVAVVEVVPGSPAQQLGFRGFTRSRSGLQLGDVITRVEGTIVKDYDDFYNALDGRRPGEQVRVTLRRGAVEETVVIPLVSVTDSD